MIYSIKQRIRNKMLIYLKSKIDQLEAKKIFLETCLKQKGLTDAELKITKMLLEENDYKKISEKLFVTEGTIRKHASNIFKKMKVSSKQEYFQTLQTLFPYFKTY